MRSSALHRRLARIENVVMPKRDPYADMSLEELDAEISGILRRGLAILGKGDAEIGYRRFRTCSYNLHPEALTEFLRMKTLESEKELFKFIWG